MYTYTQVQQAELPKKWGLILLSRHQKHNRRFIQTSKATHTHQNPSCSKKLSCRSGLSMRSRGYFNFRNRIGAMKAGVTTSIVQSIQALLLVEPGMNEMARKTIWTTVIKIESTPDAVPWRCNPVIGAAYVSNSKVQPRERERHLIDCSISQIMSHRTDRVLYLPSYAESNTQAVSLRRMIKKPKDKDKRRQKKKNTCIKKVFIYTCWNVWIRFLHRPL